MGLRDRLQAEIKFIGGHADVWRLFDDAALLREVAEALVAPFQGEPTRVAGIESRGFIIGTAAALELGVGFVPIRKSEGLFPGPKAIVETEADYRRIRHKLRLQRAAIEAGDRVLLVDDWIETGSQARAAKHLVESCGAQLVGIATVVMEMNARDGADLGRRHSLVTADELAPVDG
jgi:adenine phosphoribosyltransferase